MSDRLIGGHRFGVVLAAASAIAIASGASIVAATRGEGAPVRVAAPATTTTAVSTTTTTTAPRRVTTTTAPLPMPENPPSDPYADVPVRQIGTITIPKIGLVHPIFQGIWLTVIDHGPGHWPGSAVPGQLGNAVFAGHRVTHTHPFRNIDQLVPGDEIQFVMPDGTYTYRMTQQQIVTPADTWIVNPTPTATLTLFACHPPGSATHRIVVRADYVGKS